MKTTTENCFSNGTKHEDWVERNCVRCWKYSRWNEKLNRYTNFKCKIDEEITQQLGSYHPISLRTFKIAQMRDCPYRQEKRKRKKYRKKSNHPELF